MAFVWALGMEQPAAVLICCPIAAFLGFYGWLLVEQLRGVSQGLTMNERINFARYKHLHTSDGRSSPYDRGCLQNWRDFLDLDARADGGDVLPRDVRRRPPTPC